MNDSMWGDWGFDVKEIRAAKALIYHVRDDGLCPFEHGEWLAKHFDARKRIFVGYGHFGGAHIDQLQFIEELVG